MWTSLICLALMGCGDPAAEDATTEQAVTGDETAEAASTDHAQAYIDGAKGFNEGDLDAAFATWADDVQYSVAGLPEPIKGKEALKGFYTAQRAAFDSKVKAARILTTDDMWVVQGVYNGTHKGKFGDQGPFAEMEPTNAAVGNPYLQIGWVEDGKTTKVWLLGNNFAALHQVGAMEGEFAVPAMPAKTDVVQGAGDQARVATIEAMYASIEDGSYAGITENTAATAKHVRHDYGMAVKGADQIIEALKASPLTELKYDNHYAAVGDYVVAWGAFDANATGTMGDMEGDGRPVHIPHATVFHFDADGKVDRGETYGDPVLLIAQMSAPPATAEGGDEAE